MKRFLRNNGLSLAFIFLFMISFGGQVYCGYKVYNEELIEEGANSVTYVEYFCSGHFLQATFENWESEFLQMALFVFLTIFLMQKGSSESKDFDKEEEVDHEPSPHRKDVPWLVKKGGVALILYKHSLTIALLLLYILSTIVHFYGSLKDENLMRQLKGNAQTMASDYIMSSRFWFESFQNWQSEFLSVFAIIVLSIYLRQKGSPQSKPVDAPHSETGE